MSQEKPIILTVDDEPFNLDLLEEELMDDYQVIAASDGPAALEAADTSSPDVILLDFSMPGMDGLEVLRVLRGSERHVATPVIMLTANTDMTDRVRGLDAGADDYITKPFESEDLHARIRSALRIGRLQKALQRERDELRTALNDLHTAETQLVHSEKMAALGKLVAGVAHELNNPVGSIYANMANMQRYLGDLQNTFQSIDLDAGTAPGVDRIFSVLDRLSQSCTHGAERIKRIVQDLRTFSRLDEAELKAADIHESIDNTLALLEHTLEHRITVHRNYGDIPKVLCYAGQLNQVFMNLLSNASDAIPETGDITITTRLSGDTVHIIFQDTGTGISPDDLPHIFEPFVTTKDIGSGTGLGLSISHGIIEKHQGRIEVESEPGKGSVFTVVLPLNPVGD
jgi:signal transduction histidine kinase